MTTPASSMLTEAIAAAQAGDRSRARSLLAKLLRSDSSNTEYWIWMSAVVDSKRERKYCLESAIRLDPTNRAALRGLVILGERKPEEMELTSAIKIPRRDVAAIAKGPKVTVPREVNIPWRKLGTAAIGLAGLGALVGVFFLVRPWINSLFGPRLIGVAATLPPENPTASATPEPGTPTATPLPAATRVIRTPISTDLANTPIAFLVDITPTPTPILGVTPHAFEAYESGIKALERGDYELVLSYMDQVLDADPSLPDVHYFRAEALRYLDRIGEALTAYDRAVTQNPDYAPAYLGRGRAMLMRDQEAAVLDFNRAIDVNPTLTEAYLELGKYYAQNKLWTKLENTMLAAIESGVETPYIYVYLSEAEINLGKYEEALDYALDGSANDPTLLEGYLAVGRAYVALGAKKYITEHLNAAIWPLKTYIVYASDDHRGWATLARAQAGVGEYEEALESANTAIELSERYAPAYIARGLVHIGQGDYDLALEDFTSARRYANVTYELSLETGRAHYLLENYTQALDYINPAIEIANKERRYVVRQLQVMEAYALRALVYEAIDQTNDAILNWRWILNAEYVRPETLAMAEAHYAELTGDAPTRTPTSSPTATSPATPSGTPAASPETPTAISTP
jgi:tetratricopeptide (TPR) repeat protein